ncbi:MAG: tetratricopeptide repeat protein, partial [Planctomycetes bacterium]|nr:tetratricopeptide repeat protein [Planctomycetota bacterium]
KHPSTLRSKTELAYLLLTQGKREEAETLVRPTLELQRTLFGREDPDTLESTNVLSLVLWKQGQNVEAEELARQALDLRSALLGMEDPDTLKSMVILSNVRFAQKDYPEAESLRRQAMEIQLRILGEADPATLYSMSILANALFAQENYAEAEELHRQTLQIQRRIFGEDHPVILTSMHNLGLALWYQHRLTEAEEFYRQSWEGRCRVLTPQHPQTIKTLDNLVLVLGDQEKWDDARPLLRELIAHRKCAAEDANASPTAINGYARLLLTCWPVDLRDPATALREAKRAVQKGGEQNPYHLDTLSRAYEQAGDVELAIVAQQKVLELAPPGESLYRKKVEERLVSLYWVSGDLETAEKICRDLLARRHGANLDKSHPFIDNALELLGRTLMKRGKFADAEPIFRECLEIRREALPESDWRIPHTKSLLGASLAGQGSFEAAEPLIMDGYHEMERSSHVLAEHVQEALLRIVDLYKAWGKPGKAAEWRAKLPRTDEAEPVKP